MITSLRYFLAIALSLLGLGAVGFFIYRTIVGVPVEPGVLSANLLPIIIARVLLPAEKSLWRKIGLAGVLSAAWLNFAFYCLSLWFNADVNLSMILTGVCVAGLVLVVAVYERVRKLWLMASPGLKLVLGTIGTTVIVVCGLILLAVLAGLGIQHWHALLDNWGMTLIILYLPLMGLAWFGYDRWRKSKGRANPPE